MSQDRHKVLRERLQRLAEIKDSIEFIDAQVFKEIQKELILQAVIEDNLGTLSTDNRVDNQEKYQKQKIEIFLSYSDKDESLCESLLSHLSPLRRLDVIKHWHHHQIRAGQNWVNETIKHLDTAHVILLLISSDFINSDYCFSDQLKRAMERHTAGTARVIPILLRNVDYMGMGMPFEKLEPLPQNRCPVKSSSWQNWDEAFEHIARGIRTVIEEMTALP